MTRPEIGDLVQVFSRNTGTALSVTRQDLDTLSLCDSPRTILGHVEHVAKRTESDYGSDQLHDRIQRLVDLGLLRTYGFDVLVRTGSAKGTFSDSGRVHHTSISIPTAGRVDVTVRLLKSIIENQRDQTTQSVSVVLDRCARRTETMLRTTLQSLQDHEPRLSCSFISKKRRRSPIKRLARALGLNRSERDALRFGLMGDERFITTGATQSYSLLTSHGKQFISFDDDVISKGVKGDLTAIPRATPRGSIVVQYVHSRAELESSFDIRPVDVPKVIEPYLGKSLSEIASRNGDLDLQDSHMSPGFWARIEKSVTYVDAIVLGTVGDSGVGSTALLMSNSVRIPQLSGNAESQQIALTSRAICGIASAPTFTTQPFFMTAACAYNTERILPPFFPFGRGQDGLFGLMYTQILDDTLIGQIPVAVMHDPQDGRPDSLDRPLEGISMTVCRIVGILVSQFAATLHGGTRAERLSSFGEWIRELPQSSDSFRSWITDCICESLVQYRRRIEESYRDSVGTYSPLGSALESLLGDIDDRVRDRRVGPIDDYRNLRLSEDEEFEQLSTALRHFGIFLELWPAIWEERAIFQEDASQQ